MPCGFSLVNVKILSQNLYITQLPGRKADNLILISNKNKHNYGDKSATKLLETMHYKAKMEEPLALNYLPYCSSLSVWITES